jgi:hypothetical protein
MRTPYELCRLVWIFMDSDKEDNEWGESPKYYVENK